MNALSIDFETRSMIDLRRTGVYPYAEHPSTDLWCMAYAFGDEEPALWLPGQPLPQRIVDHIAAGGELRAWNAQFERVMWNTVGVRKHGFPVAPLEQFVDTAAEAAAMALPRTLAQAAQVLGVRAQKDDAGHRLMLQMCRPRSVNAKGVPAWWDVPEKVARLGIYCLQDVRTERDVAKVLRRLGPTERAVYLLDQRYNDRGVLLDSELALAARSLAEIELDRQNALVYEATDGRVESVTRVARLKEWLGERGLEAPSLNKAALRELLTEDLPSDVQAALMARAEAAKASVAKIDAMLRCRSADGRMRGMLLYHGAGTGRWSGRLVQPQNFPRPELQDDQIEPTIQAVLDGAPQSLATISSLLRSMLIAAPGCEFVCADFTGIELRVLAWVAGQHDLVEKLRRGEKLYHQMGSTIFGCAPTEIIKPSPEYTVAKNTVLGCGFGMGHKKFRSQLKEKEGIEVSEELATRAVDAYRSDYPAIPQFWHDINAAALSAVGSPGEIFTSGPVKYTKRGGYLWSILPSGRPLAYAQPKIVDRETPWGELRPAVEFSGVNGYTRRWERMSLYGGLLTENVVQAIARDLLAEAMLRAEARGYTGLLTVHDEILSEVPEGFGSVKEFEGIMSELPAWAHGCPVAAEGWRGRRYRK